MSGTKDSGNTKQTILDVSLALFAHSGYSAVSIRDICGAVGVRQGAIYHHFKNKQAIFDTLLAQFEEKATALMARLEGALKAGFSPLEGNFLQTVSDVYFEQYLMDDFCNKVLRLLLIEQFCSESARAALDRWMFEAPLAFQTRIFDTLIGMGVIPGGDGAALAVRYYAPLYLYAQRYLFGGPLTEEKKAAFRAAARRHLEAFSASLGGAG